LKRMDEGEVVYSAHKKPRFVEDVVRAVLRAILDRFPDLAEDTEIRVRSESMESIHKHNVFAERVTTVGELRK
ncbi:MAG: GTP cyclohydrolase I FolE2, partial [Thermoplasmata archaeon]